MRNALNMINASPVIGNGLGEYMTFFGHPHNLILQFGVDGGIISIVIITGALFYFTSIGASNIRFAQERHFILSLTVFALYVFMIANMMKSGDAYLGREWFIVIGLVLAFASYRKIIRIRYRVSSAHKVHGR